MKPKRSKRQRTPLVSRSNLSIRRKTVLGYTGFAVITIFSCLLAFIHMKYAERARDLAAWHMERAQEIYSLQLSWNTMMSSIDRMLLTRQTSMASEDVVRAAEDISVLLDSLSSSFTDGSGSKLDELEDSMDLAAVTVDSICSAARNGQWATAQITRHTNMVSAERRFNTELNTIIELTQLEVKRRTKAVEAAQQLTETGLFAAVILVFIFGSLGVFLTTRSIVRPIEYLASAVRSLKPESLTGSLHVDRKDEIGELASAFNAMRERLHEALNRLRAQVELLKQMQEALREGEEKYRSLFQHSPISLWQLHLTNAPEELTADCQSNPPGEKELVGVVKVVDVNQATRKLFAADAKAKTELFDRILIKQMATEISAALCAFARGEVIFSSETSINDTKGNTRNVIVHFAVPPDNEKGVRKVFLSLLDITARKEAEMALKESEEQYYHAQKLEAMGRLTGGIAHDFNNMLTIITNNCDIALMNQSLTPVISEHLDQIKIAASRAADVTEQLLAFSRQQVSNPVILNMNKLVENTTKMLARIIGENIQLVKKLATDLPSVKVDQGQMEQVLINLAVNARDAMPNGGRLVICTEKVSNPVIGCPHKTEIHSGDFVLVSVSDTGWGMTKEVVEKIFDPFFTTKELGKGTGLGLASAHGVVSKSGGFIDVSSAPQEGATFRIFLPEVDAEPDNVRELPQEKAPSRGTETVLLVEDEVGVREITSKALKHTGYTVIEAQDGSSAIEEFRKNSESIDILVSDVVLPGKMNGIDIAKLLRKRKPHLGILLMSGYVQEAMTRSGNLPENSIFVSKPFSLNDFLEKVRNTLNRV